MDTAKVFWSGRSPLLQLEDVGKSEPFGAIFLAGPLAIESGAEAAVELLPVIYPNPADDALQPGAVFIIREGEKIVDSGRVLYWMI